MTVTIRPLTADDIPAVLDVQRLCYRTELIESAGSYSRKIALFPDGCRAAVDRARLVGYVFAHPWMLGKEVPLDGSDYSLPATFECMYFHDLAVHPAHRRSGAAGLLVAELVAVASRSALNSFALVAVQESEAYWARWGFAARRRMQYGAGVQATYMTCEGKPSWR